MAYSKLNAFLPRKIVGNMAIYLIPQTAIFSPDNADETASLKSVSEEEWQNVARCRTATYEVATENDEEDSFDAVTKTRVKMENASISARKWTFELERYTVAYDAMYQGVKDPLSPETQELLSAGGSVPIYASNNPYIPVGMKLEMYDGEQNLLKTMYTYGNVRCDGNQTFDGKIIRPTLTLEVETSPHNVMENTAAFTGQTETA